MASIHDQIRTLQQQIRRLEESDNLLLQIQGKAKTEGGRLTQFGKDILLACHNNDVTVTETARLLNVTPSAVTQNVAKIDGALTKPPKAKKTS